MIVYGVIVLKFSIIVHGSMIGQLAIICIN